jgi:hypothetical protein
MTGKTMAAIDDVAAERKRQIEGEGYDAAHDDEHINGEIALAACCYAAPDLLFVKDDRANAIIMRDPWPWEERFDKRRYNGNVVLPNHRLAIQRRRDLAVKAAALMVAEIERLDRQLAIHD